MHSRYITRYLWIILDITDIRDIYRYLKVRFYDAQCEARIRDGLGGLAAAPPPAAHSRRKGDLGFMWQPLQRFSPPGHVACQGHTGPGPHRRPEQVPQSDGKSEIESL